MHQSCSCWCHERNIKFNQTARNKQRPVVDLLCWNPHWSFPAVLSIHGATFHRWIVGKLLYAIVNGYVPWRLVQFALSSFPVNRYSNFLFPLKQTDRMRISDQFVHRYSYSLRFLTFICLSWTYFGMTLGSRSSFLASHTVPWRHTGAIDRYWYVYRV
jgi:hypothetical protein